MILSAHQPIYPYGYAKSVINRYNKALGRTPELLLWFFDYKLVDLIHWFMYDQRRFRRFKKALIRVEIAISFQYEYNYNDLVALKKKKKKQKGKQLLSKLIKLYSSDEYFEYLLQEHEDLVRSIVREHDILDEDLPFSELEK